jgi:hypothetical protein
MMRIAGSRGVAEFVQEKSRCVREVEDTVTKGIDYGSKLRQKRSEST